MKPIIGIVPQAKLFEDDIPHQDLFLFGNPYIQRIEKQGAAPIGILSADGYASGDALSLCDGFLLTGGKKLWPYHLQVVEYAMRARKPLLGICLGMQAIAATFQALSRARSRGGDMLRHFCEMKKEGFLFNHPVENHSLENVTRETTARSTHPIAVAPGTRLHASIGKASAQAVSLHAYQIAPPTPGLSVTATAPDGVIEGIEHGGFLVGVQFHPEMDDQWDDLFAALVQGRWTE